MPVTAATLRHMRRLVVDLDAVIDRPLTELARAYGLAWDTVSGQLLAALLESPTSRSPAPAWSGPRDRIRTAGHRRPARRLGRAVRGGHQRRRVGGYRRLSSELWSRESAVRPDVRFPVEAVERQRTPADASLQVT